MDGGHAQGGRQARRCVRAALTVRDVRAPAPRHIPHMHQTRTKSVWQPLLWLQLSLGWLPIWAMFTVLIVAAHSVAPVSAALVALRMIVAAALLSVLVVRFVQRVPWPARVGVSFVLLHVAAATVFALAWLIANSALESVLRHAVVLVFGPSVGAFFVTGVWLYVLVSGVSYATSATRRAGLAEALAVRSQLAALRAQLNPHFLFNALHTVVHLIPREPARASQAAEQLAALLRATLEEDRELVTFAEERAFVTQYVALERLRFDDRLHVRFDAQGDADDALLPAFALLTLVENAVRHGAEPNIDATTIVVDARCDSGTLRVTVRDNGVGVRPPDLEGSAAIGSGTGLERGAGSGEPVRPWRRAGRRFP